MEAALGLLEKGQIDMAAAAVSRLLPFLENEQQVHFRQEEEGLFLFLARITGEGPLQAMTGEHESYWKAVAALKASVTGAEDAPRLGQVLRHIITLLRGHIHREESAYFPLAEKNLTPQQLQTVDAEIEAIGRLG
jgi:hemerythrin-like domain-containing protein